MSKAGTKGSLPLRWGREKVVEAFSADLRSLAAFRMVVAILVLADLADRATDLYAMGRVQRMAALLLPVNAHQSLLFQARSSSTSESTVLRASLAINLLAAVFLLYIFFWNLTTVSSFMMPERVVPLGHILGLEQGWSMFAPSPTKNDVWYVIPGTLSNGQQGDLMGFTRDEPSLRVGVSWEKPQHINDTFKNEHWRKYLEYIQEGDRDDLSEYLGSYLCRE
jgi:hypothetical protein